MLFLTLDVDAVEAPSIGDLCFTNQAGGPFVVRLEPPPTSELLELRAWCRQRERKNTQMLGLELSGLIG